MTEHDDLIQTMNVIETSIDDKELLLDIVQYFISDSETLKFPAKSFSVAIIYAKLLEKYFSEPFYESLSDPDLFIGTDKFFYPYNISANVKHIYDQALKQLLDLDLMDFENSNIDNVKKTTEYFRKEFGLTLKG